MMNTRHLLFPAPPPRTVLLVAVCLLGIAGPTFGQPTRSGAAAPASTTTAVDVPKLQLTRFVLPNGLVAILHEDHSLPIVAVELSYHVGSKNDVPGKTGLAHLLEHMLDEGSLNLKPGEHKRIIQEAGGTYGAFTVDDRSRYPSVVPSNQLETLLWLEAERMAFLAPTLDSVRFNLEREAARNEYRQFWLTRAAGGNLGGEAFFGTVFAGTAYQNPLIGRMEDLGNATVADLRAFHAKYYVPNNAVIVLAGDFSTPVARRWIERYFGGVPRGPAVQQPSGQMAPLTGEKRVVLEDKVAPTQQLWIGWRGAQTANPDRMPLSALAAILNARLQRLLVSERRLALGLSPVSNSFDLELAGIFQTIVIAAPTASMTEIERLVDSVVASVQDNGVTEVEVRRWAAPFATNALIERQGVAEKAKKLADSETIQGDAGAVFKDVELAKKITPQDVQRVATKYLVPQRVVMSIVPAGKLDLISKPAAPYVNVTKKP